MVIKVTFTALERSRLPSSRSERKKKNVGEPGAGEKKAADEEKERKIERTEKEKDEGRERERNTKKNDGPSISISAKKGVPYIN